MNVGDGASQIGPDTGTLLSELLRVGIAMSSEPDLTRLLELFVSSARQFTGAEAGTIFLVEGDHLEIAVSQNAVLERRYVGSDLSRRFRSQRVALAGDSVAAYAARAGAVLNIPDALALGPGQPYRFDSYFGPEYRPQFCSVLCVPLSDATSGVVGVLELLNATERGGTRTGFPREREDLIRVIAAYATVAVRNWRLQALSLKDAVTGAYNRRYFDLRVDEEISRSVRTHEPLSLALVDLDAFKAINDRHGHQAGDVVLRGVAQVLINQSRLYTVITRYGGDEFAIILPSTPAAGAAAYAERLKRIVERYPFASGGATVSIGIATMPDHGRTRDELVAAADGALYAAKQAGANRVVIADTAAPGSRPGDD